ncbi:MAG: elongation factor Ts [Alphaproteobacteria bacterium CG_4_9_14_3_um_filter_47_13]|nr:MAG: elongation factor Ts [Alphaproteobacteria bacterium CG_4_9_14_3_um_filter_47_13]
MAEITAAKVKELREMTGAGMMDSKSALVESNGDMDTAVDLLRKKGLSKAAKKSSRTAAEGLIAMAIDGHKGAVVEVNSETDFVARNEIFQDFVKKAAILALAHGKDVVRLGEADFDGKKSVSETLTALVGTIGENMTLRRSALLEVSNGVVVGYMHNALADNLGKIGVLVALESEGDKAKLEELGKKIAMHVAAAFPQYLNKESVDTSALDRERNVLLEQAKAEGKSEEIAQKMVEGRLRKFYEEVCLLEQIFVIDNETKISKLLENAAADVGAPIVLKEYTRFQLGEGIEKAEEDFAAEVAKVANG